MQLSIARKSIRIAKPKRPLVQGKRFEASYPPSPGGDRALLGIATFDSAVQFYALRPGQSAPQMLVVPDILDPYAPSASSLLVNAREARGLVSTSILLLCLDKQTSEKRDDVRSCELTPACDRHTLRRSWTHWCVATAGGSAAGRHPAAV